MTLNFSSVIISYLFHKRPVVMFIHLESFFSFPALGFLQKLAFLVPFICILRAVLTLIKIFDIYFVCSVLVRSLEVLSGEWKGLLQTLYGGGVSQKIIEGGEHVEILETPTIAKGRLYSGGGKCIHAFHS